MDIPRRVDGDMSWSKLALVALLCFLVLGFVQAIRTMEASFLVRVGVVLSGIIVILVFAFFRGRN
jgi:hypothetical protein